MAKTRSQKAKEGGELPSPPLPARTRTTSSSSAPAQAAPAPVDRRPRTTSDSDRIAVGPQQQQQNKENQSDSDCENRDKKEHNAPPKQQRPLSPDNVTDTVVVETPRKIQPAPAAAYSAYQQPPRTPGRPPSAMKQQGTPSRGRLSVRVSTMKKKIAFNKTSPTGSICDALCNAEREEESDSPMAEKQLAAMNGDEGNAKPIAIPEKRVVVLVSDMSSKRAKEGDTPTRLLIPCPNKTAKLENHGLIELPHEDGGHDSHLLATGKHHVAITLTATGHGTISVNGRQLRQGDVHKLESGDQKYEVTCGNKKAYRLIVISLTPIRLTEDQVPDWQVDHLKMYLRTRQLPTEGKKAALVERLKEAVRGELQQRMALKLE